MEPLLTERLLLRPFSSEDAKDIFELNGDPEVMKYTGDQPFGSIAEARKFILSYNHFEKWERGRYGVFLKESNTFLGWCGLKYHEKSGETDLGYRFRKEFWGKGFGTEAATIALKDGFERLHLQRIYAEAYSENKGSIKIMEKIGMKFQKETLFKGEPGVIYEFFKPLN
jgi:RimJ/RimL family protein N-acetyltransferase